MTSNLGLQSPDLVNEYIEKKIALIFPNRSNETEIAGIHFYKLAGNSLFAYFDNEIDETLAKDMDREQPICFDFRYESLTRDTVWEKVNQFMKKLSPESEMWKKLSLCDD